MSNASRSILDTFDFDADELPGVLTDAIDLREQMSGGR